MLKRLTTIIIINYNLIISDLLEIKYKLIDFIGIFNDLFLTLIKNYCVNNNLSKIHYLSTITVV